VSESSTAPHRRLPPWLKVPLPGGAGYTRLKSLVRKHGLHTVCESASCPNIGSCWGAGTLTIMILGDHCTRACRFCDVPTGRVQPPRLEEPREVAALLSQLDLRYVVITSVDRDDLPDGGASLWAETLRQVRQRCPRLKLEALIPDDLYEKRIGTTDSEALFLAAYGRGLNEDPFGAVCATIDEILDIMAEAKIAEPLRFTAAFADGDDIYAFRYSSDELAPSLYHCKEDDCLLIVSEPLDEGKHDWQAVPPGHAIIGNGREGAPLINA